MEIEQRKRKTKRQLHEENREEDEVEMPVRNVRVRNFRINQSQNNFYDDKTQVPNIMLMSQNDRLNFIRNHPNPFGYPKQYWDIYLRERERRNLKGFENLMKVNGIKLFNNEVDQIPGKMIIKNHRNVNCIKSKEEFNTDIIEEINFNNDIYELMKESGMYYVIDKNKFIEMCLENDEYYEKSIKDLMDTYYLERFGLTKNNVSLMNRNYVKESEIETEITAHFIETFWEPEYNQIVKNKNCDVYDCILFCIRNILDDLYQYVAIAGGFALSMYIFKNYGYHIGFKDIDIFIHSCSSEIKDLIISRMKEHFIYTSYNDNVISFSVSCLKMDERDDHTSFYTKNIPISVQIIRRLYSCPQEVIAGFDVDSCCILTTMEGEIWITERGAYALSNGYNTFNFERMSPSYEYRLLKYGNRGFGIWIPFIDYFKDNAIFDFYKMEKSRGSTIFLRKLCKMFNDKLLEKKAGVDYNSADFQTLKNNISLEFKTLNPNEQTINTFHRIFLDDPITWYPKAPENTINNFNLNMHSNIPIEIKDFITIEHISAKNIITKRKNRIISSRIISNSAFSLLNFLYSINNNIVVYNDYPISVIFGSPFYKLEIEDNENINKNYIELMYKLYTPLFKFINTVKKLKNIDLQIDPYQFMKSCKYVYKYYDQMNLIDIDDTSDNCKIYINKNIYFSGIFTEASFDKFLKPSYIKPENFKNSISVILPESMIPLFKEIHLILQYNSYCQDVKDKINRDVRVEIKEKYYNSFIKTHVKEEERRINKRIPIASWDELRQIKEKLRTIMASDESLMSFEEYIKEEHTDKNGNIVVEDPYMWIRQPNEVEFIKPSRSNSTKFQFRNGKIYGTEYEIVKYKYGLEDSKVLEYPVIENFVPS